MALKIYIKKLPAHNLEYYFNIFLEDLKKVAESFRIFDVSGNIRISSLQNIKKLIQRWDQNSRWRRFEW
jgi:dsDNA-specific endonuclease/ATPase MutS2